MISRKTRNSNNTETRDEKRPAERLLLAGEELKKIKKEVEEEFPVGGDDEVKRPAAAADWLLV